jgi:chromosomal replication initiation ATPase DnaA
MDTASDTIEEQPPAPPPGTSYERWATVFSRVHAEVGSIAVALEVLDTYRARQSLRPRPIDVPRRILALSAAVFYVPVHRLLERNRHRDVADARYVAAWVLRRRRWGYEKIAEFFGLDHSTIIHGLRKVAANDHLLLAASKVEHTLELELEERAAGQPF